MLFPFIIRTVIIKEIGMEYAGLNSLFNSILMVLSISELGFGSALVYSMYKPVAEKDEEKVCALLKLYRTIYRYVGMIIMVIGFVLLPFIRFFIKEDVPEDINIYVLYLIFLFNTVISYFVFSYKSALLTATQREDVNTNILMLTNLIMYICQVFLLILLKNFMAYIILLPIFTIVANLIRSVVVDKMYPQYQCKGSISKEELRDIFKNVGALVGNRINGTIILSADSIVISAVLGLTAVACYNNYYLIINALLGFFMVFFNAIRPSVGNSIVMDSLDKNYNDFKRISLIILWIVSFCSISMICLFQPFMILWVGEEYLLPFSTVVMLGVYFYEWKMLDVLVLYRDAAGMWWSDRFRPYIVSVLNIIGNVTLVYFFGLNGVVFATLFTSLCISYPWVLIVLFKEYFKRNAWDYLKLLSCYTLIAIACGVGTYYLCSLCPDSGVGAFVIKTLICLVAPNTVLFFTIGLKPEIRSLAVNIIHRKFKTR